MAQSEDVAQAEIKRGSTVGVVGQAYDELKCRVEKYAKAGLNVLFVGEIRSGKELFAKFYIEQSGRTKSYKVNCAGVSDELLHSMVFGHVKGAFTGAASSREGAIDKCKDGILFLDEIGDASEAFQAAILRVAEGNSYSKLGSDDEKSPEDVLIIAATNKPEKVREDLKHRFTIAYIPPLQRSDIPVLAESFLKKPLKPEYIEILVQKEYTGNIRELKRECEELSAIEGKKIFDRRRSSTIPVSDFDYERFESEIKTWYKHVQPIVDEYCSFQKFKYKYMPLLDCDDLDNADREVISGDDAVPENIPGIVDIIYYINRDFHKIKGKTVVEYFLSKSINYSDFLPVIEDFPGAFIDCMDYCFDRKLLPVVLSEIRRKHENHDAQSTESQMPHPNALLKLPMKEAELIFRISYLEHLRKIHINDPDKAYRIAGIPKTAYEQRLKRYKDQLRQLTEK